MLDLCLLFHASCLLLCCFSSCLPSYFFVLDAAGIEFDRGALEHWSALDDAIVVVEDRCSTVVSSLAKAKEVLGRFYQELFPKGATLDDVDAVAEALSGEAPAAYKRKQKGIGASVGLAMAMAAGAELDLPQITSRMPTATDRSEVAFAAYSTRCRRYGPKLIDLLSEYALRQQGEAKARQSGSEATRCPTP